MDEFKLLESQLKIVTWRRTLALDLHGRRVLSSAASAERLLQSVREVGGIASLDLSGTQLSDAALGILMKGSVGCGRLCHLKLGQTLVGDVGLRLLIAWADAAALQTLTLSSAGTKSLPAANLWCMAMSGTPLSTAATSTFASLGIVCRFSST